jgi:hypothetical protein
MTRRGLFQLVAAAIAGPRITRAALRSGAGGPCIPRQPRIIMETTAGGIDGYWRWMSACGPGPVTPYGQPYGQSIRVDAIRLFDEDCRAFERACRAAFERRRREGEELVARVFAEGFSAKPRAQKPQERSPGLG